MADVKKMATREGYGRGLVALGAEHEDIVALDADLAGSTKTGMFAKAYPDRHFNCGIAEADMMCVAAGFAANGFVPFASSFAMFAAGRAFEQIRNSIGYPHLNVKIGASHGGLSVGEDGATHQCIEDLAIMRAIPNMTVLCPCDGNEMKQAVKALLAYDGPAYLRLGRLAVETVTDQVEGYEFQIGKGVLLRDGQDVTVVAVGMMVQMALTAADILAEEGISVRVIDMHTIKPLDVEAVTAAVNDIGKIITVEDHNILNGLGSAVCEVAAEMGKGIVKRVGIQDQFGQSAPYERLLAINGVTVEHIVELAQELARK